MHKSEWFNTRLSKWTVQSHRNSHLLCSLQHWCSINKNVTENSTSPIIPTAALSMAAQHSLRGARATDPQFPKGEPEPSSVPMPCPWLEDLGALGVSEITGFFLCYLPEKASTQQSSASLHIPPAVHSSRRHQSYLYYQDFLKHTEPSSIVPFSHTIKRADIKFSKYPSF